VGTCYVSRADASWGRGRVNLNAGAGGQSAP